MASTWIQNFIEQPLFGMVLFLLILIRMSIVDIRTCELPLLELGLYGGTGLLWNVLAKPFSRTEILGGLVICGGMFVISFLSRESIGRGDCYLLTVGALFLGYRILIPVLMLACILASVWGGFLMLRKKAGRKHRVPFVPFLLVAQLVVLPFFVAEGG